MSFSFNKRLVIHNFTFFSNFNKHRSPVTGELLIFNLGSKKHNIHNPTSVIVLIGDHSQQLCQSQGHRWNKKSRGLFWSFHQSNSQHKGAMQGGSMLGIDWTTCCVRCPSTHPPNPQTRTLDPKKTLKPCRNTNCSVANVYLWHFKVAGFCGFQSWFSTRKHEEWKCNKSIF